MTRLALTNDFFSILDSIHLHYENQLESFALWAEIIRLSVYAFMIIRMKYDSAIFSLLLSLMDVILTQLLVQHMSETSHTCLKQLFHWQIGSFGYILNVKSQNSLKIESEEVKQC